MQEEKINFTHQKCVRIAKRKEKDFTQDFFDFNLRKPYLNCCEQKQKQAWDLLVHVTENCSRMLTLDMLD